MQLILMKGALVSELFDILSLSLATDLSMLLTGIDLVRASVPITFVALLSWIFP